MKIFIISIILLFFNFLLIPFSFATILDDQSRYAENLTPDQRSAINAESQSRYGSDTFDGNGALIPGRAGADGLGGPITDMMEGFSNTNDSVAEISAANCSFNPEIFSSSIGDAIDDCLDNSKLVDGEMLDFDGGTFDNQVNSWVMNISLYLGVFAVGTIVYGSLMLTLSTGEDEKIKKAKDIIKWGIIGFLGLISASGIILVIIKIMYSL